MRRRLRTQPITTRITAGFLCAMAVLFALTGAFIYERMHFALNRSIHDVPSTNQSEIDARVRHRDEALHELLVQLAVAFSGTLLISGVVGYRVARQALDPVERMRRRANAESADASFRLPVPDTNDELTRLAETLNELLARVEAGVERERRLIADASHELRTPLAQLLLRIDLALSRERPAGEMRATLVDLQHDSRRLVRLANDLLLLARVDDGQLSLRREPVCVLDAASGSAGRFREAADLLEVDAELYARFPEPWTQLRRSWLQGKIAAGVGDVPAAERLFTETRDGFVRQGIGYDAAMVSLDLALLYLREGRTGEVRRVAEEMVPVFSAQDVHREATAALLLFQEAARREEVTAGLVREVAGFLKAARGDAEVRFR